jgi:hypothetical protein
VEVSHVIRSIAERLVESPKDVLRNPWVSLFFSPDSSGSGESYIDMIFFLPCFLVFDVFNTLHLILA